MLLNVERATKLGDMLKAFRPEPINETAFAEFLISQGVIHD